MQLTQQDINALRLFLGRATLTGNEVGALVELANKLTAIEQFINTPKGQRGNKNLPPTGQ